MAHVVRKIEHLAERPRSKEALQTLQQIAAQVQPMLEKRQWTVGVLQEFVPKNAGLLGVNYNHGEKICLRLRRNGDESSFIPYEQVLDTMLHEMSHITRSEHDANFYKLWDELRAECETLISKGITGSRSVFLDLGDGNKLGGRRAADIRSAQVNAAIKRQQYATLTAGTGQKLGGDNALQRRKSARELAAECAERRQRDALWCATKQMEDLGLQSIDKSNRGDSWDCPKCTYRNVGAHSVCDVCEDGRRPLDMRPKTSTLTTTTTATAPATLPSKAKWSCCFCTFENIIGARECGGCALDTTYASKPSSWSCGSCTSLNFAMDTKCVTCLQVKT